MSADPTETPVWQKGHLGGTGYEAKRQTHLQQVTQGNATAPKHHGHHGAGVGHHPHTRAAPGPTAGPAGTRVRGRSSVHAAAPAAAAAAALAKQRRGHHHPPGVGHHPAVGHHPGGNSTAALGGVLAPGASGNLTNRLSNTPGGTVGPPSLALLTPPVAPPPPPASHGLGGGAIFGIVLAVLVGVGLAVFGLLRMRSKKHRDPLWTVTPTWRNGGYWKNTGKAGMVSHPDDDTDTFDEDFKNWVEVVGASGHAAPGTGPTQRGGPFPESTIKKSLSRIPSGQEPLGSNETGSLVYQEHSSSGRSAPQQQQQHPVVCPPMVTTPVSPLLAPPGFEREQGRPSADVAPLSLDGDAPARAGTK